MKRDINYIIRRVIVALLIIFILSFVRNCEVKGLSYYDLNLSANPSLYHEVLYWNSSCDTTYGCYNSPGISSGDLPFLQYNFQIGGTGYSVQNYAASEIWATGGVYSHRFYAPGISGSNLIGKRFFTFIIGGQYNGFNNARYLIRDTTTTTTAIGTWFPCEPLTLPTDAGSSTFTQFACELWYEDFDANHTYEIITQSIGKTLGDFNTTVKGFTTYYGAHIFFYSDYSQETYDKLEEVNQAIDETNSLISSDDTTEANGQVDTLLDNAAFQDSTGLTAVISTPLNFISSLNNTCTPINLTLPYFKNNTQVTLPCISSLLQSKVPTVKALLSVVINGFIVYRVLIELFYIVKSARNPEDDRIEVLDL